MSNCQPSTISQQQYQEFDHRLLMETELLEQWFNDQVFMERKLEAGSEIEFFLLNENYDPAFDNLKFIAHVNQPFLVPEVGSAHLEINSSHVSLSGDFLSKLHQDILLYWQQSCRIARQHHYHLALIGSLPTATNEHHQVQFMTNKMRYHMIDDCMTEQRAGMTKSIDINGIEPLHFQPQSLAVNGLISAFQLHMQIGLSQSVHYYNIAQAIAGPMLVLACNSPFIFGHHLWSDSRIFLFDQAVTIPRFDRSQGFKCCSFGTSYLKDSFFELFEQNYQFYPRLIPDISANESLEKMAHVRLQNSVVYRWNRPIIDFNANGQPHLRIEHRGPSTGPTIVDMIANAAFFYGLLHYFAIQPTPIEYLLPFHCARKNFFNAARAGFNAEFNWFLGKKIAACDLLHDLVVKAEKGLLAMGIIKDDIDHYLTLINHRIQARINGSTWQCDFINKYGKDFHNMMASYLFNQYEELPITQWKI